MMGSPEATKAGLKKLRKILGIHHSINEDDAEPAGDGEPAEPKAEESKKLDPWVILDECKAQGYTPTPNELKILAGEKSADVRKAFVTEQRAKVPAAQPKSAQRMPGGMTATPTSTPTPAPTVTEQRAFPAWN